jgi:galactoside O-acetyltransferase
MMAWLSLDELSAMGFAAIGEGVLISDKASFYNCANISLGNNVRIDDFCVLSAGIGGIFLGDCIHVAVYTSLIGSGKITLFDFCNLSSRVSIYSSNDDYSGKMMTNPTVPSRFTGVTHADVTLGKHVIIGAGSVILPGVTLHEGVAVGALSLINDDCAAFGIYAGIPAKRIGERKKDLLKIEKELLRYTEKL